MSENQDSCRISMKFSHDERLLLEYLSSLDRRPKTQQINWLVEEEFKRRGLPYQEALDEAAAKLGVS